MCQWIVPAGWIGRRGIDSSVQRQWSAMVARINRQVSEEARLDEYLFGLSRIDLDPVRRPLREIQSNRCFYCRQPISGIAEVDHFIPWTRHPDNGIENLVATDSRCNNAKRNFLAAVRHVDRWMERFADASTGRDLREVAESVGWESHRDRTLSVARSIYLQLPADAKLWYLRRDFVPADPSVLRRALAPSEIH